MQETIRAIVISKIQYTDNSSVIRLYSREKGVITCMAGRMHGKRSALRSSLFQPLTILNVVTGNSGKGMLSIKEASPVFPFHSATSDPLKSSVVIFLAEVLGHTLIESHPDEATYDFIEQSLIEFELAGSCPSDFHLSFLWKLTSFIGIGPRNDYDHKERKHFDIVNGSFAEEPVMISIPVNSVVSQKISYFLSEESDLIVSSEMSREMRREMIHHTISYYSYHLGWQKELRSIGVLHEVFEV